MVPPKTRRWSVDCNKNWMHPPGLLPSLLLNTHNRIESGWRAYAWRYRHRARADCRAFISSFLFPHYRAYAQLKDGHRANRISEISSGGCVSRRGQGEITIYLTKALSCSGHAYTCAERRYRPVLHLPTQPFPVFVRSRIDFKPPALEWKLAVMTPNGISLLAPRFSDRRPRDRPRGAGEAGENLGGASCSCRQRAEQKPPWPRRHFGKVCQEGNDSGRR